MKLRCAIAASILVLGVLSVMSVHALEAGEQMPPVAMQDLEGRTFDRARVEGKVVVVDFWASWCKPCRDELPVLDRLYASYRTQGLVVVGVSVDNKLENVKGFLKKHPVTFPVVHDAKHAVTGRFAPPSMPSSYVIDRKGVVRYVHRGFRAGDGERLEAQIKKLLAEPK